MKIANKVVGYLCRVVAIISGLAGLFMMFVTAIDTFMRIAFNKPGVGTYEMVQYAFCLLFFGALAWCAYQHRYLHVTMFISRFPEKVAMALWAILELLSCGMCFYLSYACLQQSITVQSQHLTSTILLLPNAPFYYFGALCVFIFALQLFLDFIKAALAVFIKSYADEIRSEWT